MKSTTIILDCQYLSEAIDVLPSHCLLNKGITGCGGTTVELESKRNSIILCPTRNLVTSKSALGYFGVDGNISKTQIKEYLETEHSFKKIVATYDALEKLMESIPDYSKYFLLIDEYHLLFNDYSFRKNVIQFILHNFTKFEDWCFMTATPLKEEFILEELKDINQINYEWTKATPVNMIIKDTFYIQKILFEYINLFKDRNLHIFLNSISTIYNITKQLPNDDFRVVCSENSKTKIKNFSKITSPVKKINFYTSCAFEGADIYDPDGVTIIVCDTNISTTVLDIATKVRQICGRLRDSKYKNECYLILNTTKHRYAGTTNKDFNDMVSDSEQRGKRKYSDLEKLDEYAYQTELKLYSETYSTLYLNKFKDRIFYDENLKKIDLYNYKLISEIYSNSISVMNEANKNLCNAEIKNPINCDCESWILENLTKCEWTYNELEEIFKPLFEKHKLKWNKNTSIKYHFPPFKKRIRLIKGKQMTVYLFYL